MSSARTPLLTDIVALVTFDGRVYPNEAKPLEQVGLKQKTRPLEEALEQWFSFATGKHTWVSVHGATIRGLISARQRAKRSVWEVEVLINATDDTSVALSLFGQMASGVIRQGAERVFLRLDEESAVRDTARSAGFFRYVTETLYRRPAGQHPPTASTLPLRARKKGDVHGIYQLYSRAVPANVRAIEGATLRQWQAAQEKWGGRCTDLLLEDNGVIGGWARVMPGNVARLYVLAKDAPYDELLASALAHVGGKEALCLVPDHNPGLASALGRAGFEPAACFLGLAKRLSRPVEELAAEKAGEAVPVG
jgi:hypothetical protein